MIADDAQNYVATILGGTTNDKYKGLALQSIGAAMEWLAAKAGWSFLMADTSQTFTVVSSSAASATLTTSIADGFAGILKGMSISGTNIPANTTVLSIESTTSLTMSAAATGAVTGEVITFGGTIPILAGVDTYKLPVAFDRPISARLVTGTKAPLKYIRQQLVDWTTWDQTIAGEIVEYTVYNGASPFVAGGPEQSYLKLRRVPQQNDTLLLRYYRFPNYLADPIDWSRKYIFLLLDIARVHLLATRNSNDTRIPSLRADLAERLFTILDRDKNDGGDDQVERFISPTEMGGPVRGLIFYPSGDF